MATRTTPANQDRPPRPTILSLYGLGAFFLMGTHATLNTPFIQNLNAPGPPVLQWRTTFW